jgi:hypothetical protein
MKFTKSIVAAAITLLAVAAHADTFNYSIKIWPVAGFVHGTNWSGVVNGSFDGSVNGNLVTDLSNITAYINGVEFVGSGHLFGSSWDGISSWVSGGAIASLDGTENNFLFSDVDFPNDVNMSNYLMNQTGAGNMESLNFGNPGPVSNVTRWSYPGPVWNLTQVSEVPEPATYALLLAGLGAMGGIARRRKAKQA